MSTIDNGGYAFPSPSDEKAGWHSESGMTRRDWIAAQVLAGIGTWMPQGFSNLNTAEARVRRAEWAYAQADALIAVGKAGA